MFDTYEEAVQELQNIGSSDVNVEAIMVETNKDGKYHFLCQEWQKPTKLIRLEEFLNKPKNHLCETCFQGAIDAGTAVEARSTSGSFMDRVNLSDVLKTLMLLSTRKHLLLEEAKSLSVEQHLSVLTLLGNNDRVFREKDYQQAGYANIQRKDQLMGLLAQRIKTAHLNGFYDNLKENYQEPTGAEDEDLFSEKLEELLKSAEALNLPQGRQVLNSIESLKNAVLQEELEGENYLLIDFDEDVFYKKFTRVLADPKEKLFQAIHKEAHSGKQIWLVPLKIKNFLQEYGYPDLNHIIISEPLSPEEVLTVSTLMDNMNGTEVEKLKAAHQSVMALR